MVSRITTIALAVVASLVTFFIVRAIDVVPMTGLSEETAKEMDAFSVLFVTIVVGFGAMLAAAFLDKFSSEAKRIWTIVAVIILGLSVFPVYRLGMDTTTVIWQIIIQVVYGLIIIGGFWLSWPEGSPESGTVGAS